MTSGFPLQAPNPWMSNIKVKIKWDGFTLHETNKVEKSKIILFFLKKLAA